MLVEDKDEDENRENMFKAYMHLLFDLVDSIRHERRLSASVAVVMLAAVPGRRAQSFLIRMNPRPNQS